MVRSAAAAVGEIGMDTHGDAFAITQHHTWPAEGETRIPDWVCTDQPIYEREVGRIFRRRTWNYVALEAEIPMRGTSSAPMSGRRRSWRARPTRVRRGFRELAQPSGSGILPRA